LIRLKGKSSAKDIYFETRIKRLKELLSWRKLLPIVRDSVREVLGNRPVYVFGSAVRGELTVDSDIDIAIIVDKVPESARERVRIIDEIWRRMEDRGVSFFYPFELHLMSESDKRMLEKGGAKFVRIEELLL